jgi:hypothetical protein
MLEHMQNNTYPESGLLRLNIAFENGQPRVSFCEFQPDLNEVNNHDKKCEFGSKLLAVISGSNRSISAIDALVVDLQKLAGPCASEFFPSLTPKIKGRSRLHIAQDRSKVYPLRPNLSLQNNIQLADGWFLGTNISNAEKRKILKAACELKGLKLIPENCHSPSQ